MRDPEGSRRGPLPGRALACPPPPRWERADARPRGREGGSAGRKDRGGGRAALALAVLLGAQVALAGCLREAPQEAQTASPITVLVEGPDAVAVGDTVTLMGRAAGVPDGTAFWFWDFGDGSRREGVDLDLVEHEYAQAGAFRVTLTVVDATGHRGENGKALAVNQEFAFEGTVSAPTVLGVGGSAWSSAFPAGENATGLVVEVRVRDAGAIPAGEVAVGGTAPRVLVRVLAPANENETERALDVVLLEVPLDVDADGERLRAVVAGDRFASPADLVLEVVPERGATHFAATLRVGY